MIDASARPLREAHGPRWRPPPPARPTELLERLAPLLEDAGASRSTTACASAATTATSRRAPAVRLASLLRYALGSARRSTPTRSSTARWARRARWCEDLTAALTKGIDELTRPVDAIKHQAKTVTVGISRSDETLLQVPLVRAVLAAGAPRDGLSYRVAAHAGGARPGGGRGHGLHPLPHRGRRSTADAATLHVVDRGGVAAEIPSRTDDRPAPARHEAPCRHPARGHGRARPQRRSHARARARGQGQRDGRAHAAARAVRRPAAGRGDARGAPGLPGALRRARRTPSPRPMPAFDDDGARARSPSSSCSPSRSTCSPTAGAPLPA